ncbi:SGNH/GDSL hydrolase family protein [Amycolatopsis sp. H20-H5]|uniref:SGNH/GDSL hydrolase family protein n=1 Tax=Amycolatopsis sp. H20-H5 TaxID=3046309 RepID=UPI002DBE3716|nr:SGNH/GDSL hydrolase family protein [Amycolatopsis sp. H20-H5]MEC3980583.1 SGNH/GDSL hydrolase family protein [Amycolatopsis sp. H20-H5]
MTSRRDRRRLGPLDVVGVFVPGIRRVRAQKEPFAAAWRTANDEALRGGAPLWVALGDSMTQGIGAPDFTRGWVGQAHARLATTGHHLGVVNLSVTGARIEDVVTEQLPRLLALPSAPMLVTVLVGANDMLSRTRRLEAPDRFAALLAALPAGKSVVATLPQGNPQALAVNTLIDHAAATGALHVADFRGPALGPIRGTLADDWFHPNERGYARIASLFEVPIRRALRAA